MKIKTVDTTQGAQGHSEERKKGASFCPHTGLHAPSGKETARCSTQLPSREKDGWSHTSTCRARSLRVFLAEGGGAVQASRVRSQNLPNDGEVAARRLVARELGGFPRRGHRSPRLITRVTQLGRVARIVSPELLCCDVTSCAADRYQGLREIGRSSSSTIDVGFAEEVLA